MAGLGEAEEEEKESYGGGGGGGGQLYVSLQLENNHKLNKDDDLLLPHVIGSVPLVGSLHQSKALCMERESASMWELSFVVPPNHETLDFKFLLKSKYNADASCVVEEGLNRQLIGGALQGDARYALFRISSDEVLEYCVFIKANRVSPFDLAASCSLPPFAAFLTSALAQHRRQVARLELDLEHYVVPAPPSIRPVYAANNVETPRNITGVSTKSDGSINSSYTYKNSCILIDPSSKKEMEAVIPDSSKMNSSSGMVESMSVGTSSPFQKQDSRRVLQFC